MGKQSDDTGPCTFVTWRAAVHHGDPSVWDPLSNPQAMPDSFYRPSPQSYKAGGGIENKHSSNAESPPPPPRVCTRIYAEREA